MSRVVSGNVAAFDDTGYTPVRDLMDRGGPNRPRPSRLTSRRQSTAADNNNVPYFPGGPYGWVEPPVWQDGAVYGATELNQQFIINMEHVLRPIIVIEERWQETISSTTYVPTLNFTLGANETWVLKYCLIFSAGDDWTHQWRGPTGITLTGSTSYLDNDGATYVNDAIFGAGPTYSSWQGFGWPFGTNQPWPLFIDVLVSSTTAGVLEFGFDVNSSGQFSIWPGSIILGVKVSEAV